MSSQDTFFSYFSLFISQTVVMTLYNSLLNTEHHQEHDYHFLQEESIKI